MWSNLHSARAAEKEFRIMIVKMIKNLEKMEKIQESITKQLEELKNNTITEIKNTLEGINNRISEADKSVSWKVKWWKQLLKRRMK